MFKKVKNLKYEAIIFIVEMVCMILELVASRVISPYFGNSNIVWTSVIGIILLSGSLGNYFGGIIIDKDKENKIPKLLLILAGILTFIIPIFQNKVIYNILGITTNKYIGTIFTVLILFFMPYFFLGFFTPIVIKKKIENKDDIGKNTGRIVTISTIGGLVGTFLGGFFLIPKLRSTQILFVLSIVLFSLAIVIDIKKWKNIIVAVMIVLSIITMNIYLSNNKNNGALVMEWKENVPVNYDTEYGNVTIYNGKYNNEEVRYLNIDSGYESATFIDESKKYELVFKYSKYYDYMFDANVEINNVLLIGGAGYSYPKYYISHFENRNIDVVEIDSRVTEIAKEYFYLNDLIEDYDLISNKRLNLINDDGRTYLNNNQKKYDAILNDAFSGETPARTLTTYEDIVNTKKSLNENGLYLTNIISSLEGENSKFLRAEVNTLKQVFKNVYIIPCNDVDVYTIGNNMVIATDDDIYYKDSYDLQLGDDEVILTDDYCPIDTLIPKK